jgi:hypothetical protein
MRWLLWQKGRRGPIRRAAAAVSLPRIGHAHRRRQDAAHRLDGVDDQHNDRGDQHDGDVDDDRPSGCSTTLPPVTDVPLAGRLLSVGHRRDRTVQTHVVRARSEVLAPPTCAVDGELVMDAAGGPPLRVPLPAAGWQALEGGPAYGCRYWSDAGTSGPSATVVLLVGKRMKIRIKNVDVAHAPLDVDPRPIVYTLHHGDVRYCTTFGGDMRRLTSRRLLARGATSPASCPTE